jgi:transposase-like protein
MSEDTNTLQFQQSTSEEHKQDPLTELAREGARKLLADALEAEVQELLDQYRDERHDGRQAVTRNGYLPERNVETGVGSVSVQVPKVRDKSGQGIKFNSSLVPPYLKRSRNLEEFVPLLYLKGVSSGDMSEALSALTGQQASLSPNTLSRLKQQWQDEHQAWCQRRFDHARYVYLWADGVYFNVRGDDHRQCLLVVIGVRDDGKKELLAVDSGYRESESSWYELFQDLHDRGLQPPQLIIADGMAGLWKAAQQVFPKTDHQRCWVHKTANVLNKMPKTMQPKVKRDWQSLWMAESRNDADEAFDRTLNKYEAKYPKAMHCLQKDRQALLAFYRYPAKHWQHIRTTNPIESTFATVRLRTDQTRNCVSSNTILAMVFKLAQSAEKRWQRIRGFRQLGDVIEGVKFRDGIKVNKDDLQDAA